MEKVIIKNDFYETASIVKDVFEASLNGYLLTHDGPFGAAASINKPGILMSRMQHELVESIGPHDHIQCVDFAFEIHHGMRVVGKYIYRRNKRGIEMLSGTTVITERDE